MKNRKQKVESGKKSEARIESLRQLLLQLRMEEEKIEYDCDQSSSFDKEDKESSYHDHNEDNELQSFDLDHSAMSKDDHAGLNTSKIYYDPKIHIVQTTYTSAHAMHHAVHSKISYRQRENEKICNRVMMKNQQIEESGQQEVQKLAMYGLFCCNIQDPDTHSMCLSDPFISERQLMDHINFGKHRFHSKSMISQATSNAINGKYAFCLALGSMTNRDRTLCPDYEICQSVKNFPTHVRIQKDCKASGIYRRDCEAWKKPNFIASPELTKDIRALFDEGENHSSKGKKKNAQKYKAPEAAAVLQNMMDGNRRKYRADGPHGMLPDHVIDYIQRKFSEWARKGSKGLSKEASDALTRMNTGALKQLYEERFGEQATDKAILRSMLKVDDEIKQNTEEGDDNIYLSWNVGQLKEEFKRRKLPFDKPKAILVALHHAFEVKAQIESTKNTQNYQSAVMLTEASSTHYNILHGNTTIIY